MTKARSNATAPNAKGTLVVGNGTDASTTLAVASTAGYILTVDSAEATGLKWAAAGGGDVVLLASASFSAVSSVALANNILSATYKFYRIFINFTASSASGDILFRQRQGGSDYTSDYYSGGYIVDFNGTGTNATTNNQSAWNLRAAGARIGFSVDLIGWDTSTPKISASGVFSGTAQGGATIGGFCLGSGTPDSLSFASSTGTFTGKYALYGFKN